MNAEIELLNLKNEKEAKNLMRFFKTGKGEYGEGDLFLGIKVPTTRKIAKKYYLETEFFELEKMLSSKYHEIRLCALLMMILKYEKENKKEEVLKLYVENVKNINNWDLVDLSAPKIIGANYLETKNDEIIKMLADSGHLWSMRIAVVSQLSVVKNGEFELLIELSKKFLTQKHDLMQKAVGWILREMGKKDEKALITFLNKYKNQMPRTMLRYSLEKLSPEQKKFYMKKD